LLPTDLNKPLMIGESGGTYYAKPSQLAVFNGEYAYESYAGRNEALGIDVYQNVVQMARPKLAYFSASELAWFGLEHLPLGYNDFTRLPTLQDGVFFKPFEEGKPGMQPERLPPYCTTLNPGWDPFLPLYKPLAMFDAMKAALAKNGPQSSPWDHEQLTSRPATTNEAIIAAVGFVGDRDGKLFAAMKSFGVPFTTNLNDVRMFIVDGENLTTSTADEIKPQIDGLLAHGGLVLVCFHQPNAKVAPINLLLLAPITLTSRTATALDRGIDCYENANFSPPDLYFAENTQDKKILKCGLDGNFVRRGTVVFKASNTDWSQFNDVPENAKCAAVVLYEHLVKPPGAALVTIKQGGGTISISTIDYVPNNSDYAKLWHSLLNNMGVKMDNEAMIKDQRGNHGHDLLLKGSI